MRIFPLLITLSLVSVACGPVANQAALDSASRTSSCSGFPATTKTLDLVYPNINVSQLNVPSNAGNVALRYTATPGCSGNRISQPSSWNNYYGAQVQTTAGQFDFEKSRYCSAGHVVNLDPDLRRQYWLNYLAGLALTPGVPADVKVYAACKAKIELLRTQQVSEGEKIDSQSLSFLQSENAKAKKGIELLISFWPLDRVLSGASYIVKYSKGKIVAGYAAKAAGGVEEVAQSKVIGNLVQHADEVPALSETEVVFSNAKKFCVDECPIFAQAIGSLREATVHIVDSHPMVRSTAFSWIRGSESYFYIDETAGGIAKAIEHADTVLRDAEVGKEFAKGAGWVTKDYERFEDGKRFVLRLKFAVSSSGALNKITDIAIATADAF